MGLTQPKGLVDLRDQWERGLEVVQEFDLFKVSLSCLVVVLEVTDDEHPDFSGGAMGTFQVLRYFQIGGSWTVSMDLTSGDYKEAFAALSSQLY